MKNNKRKTRRKKDLVRVERINSWLNSHKIIGFFLVLGLILGIGLGINFIFKSLPLPSLYRDINYSFPLYVNLFCLVYRIFDYWFLDLSRLRLTLTRFAGLFIYLNSIGLVVHLFFGVSGKNSKGILPSLLSLDYRYIWFPISTYMLFFFLGLVILLLAKHLEKKKLKK